MLHVCVEAGLKDGNFPAHGECHSSLLQSHQAGIFGKRRFDPDYASCVNPVKVGHGEL